MSLDNIIYSIIMPTYNSQNTIEKALHSIRMQDFPQELIEILVIDGGSTDETLNIAQKFDAHILKNEKKFPEYAKQIGIQNARGKYIVYQDSDEELITVSQLSNRLKMFQNNPEVHCILANILLPGKNCGFCCSYLNTLADPFGYFVHKYKGSIIKNNKAYLKTKTTFGNIYHYEEGDILPIGDGGTTTLDLDKAKELFGDDVYSQDFASSTCSQLVSKTKYVGCSEDDNIIHHSLSTFRGYLKKLHFKIVLNLNHEASAGFVKREQYSRQLTIRKYLFVFYGASLVLPILDSIRLSFLHKDIKFLLHFFYTYYILITLTLETIKKLLGIKSTKLQYGK